MSRLLSWRFVSMATSFCSEPHRQRLAAMIRWRRERALPNRSGTPELTPSLFLAFSFLMTGMFHSAPENVDNPSVARATAQISFALDPRLIFYVSGLGIIPTLNSKIANQSARFSSFNRPFSVFLCCVKIVRYNYHAFVHPWELPTLQGDNKFHNPAAIFDLKVWLKQDVFRSLAFS